MLEKDNIEKIKILSEKFREAMEQCRWDLSSPFHGFPKGSCGGATDLLGAYLKDEGCGEFNYIGGERGEGEDRHTHAWLEQRGVIVDITADQFPEIHEKVIITREFTWYENFEITAKHVADYKIGDYPTKSWLEKDYKTILSVIEGAG